MPYITCTAARNNPNDKKPQVPYEAQEHTFDTVNDFSLKFYKAAEHLALENLLATIQTAVAPPIQNTRAHNVTLDIKHKD